MVPITSSCSLGQSATHPVVTKAAADQIQEWKRVYQVESAQLSWPALRTVQAEPR